MSILFLLTKKKSKAFTGKEPEDSLNELAEQCEIAVVKIGSKGSLIKSNGKVIKIDPIKVNPVDTTGAGDLFASGFLFGLTNNIPLEKCGNLGSLCAGKVIEVIGSKNEQ